MDLYGDHHSDQDPERRKPGRTSKDFLKVSSPETGRCSNASSVESCRRLACVRSPISRGACCGPGRFSGAPVGPAGPARRPEVSPSPWSDRAPRRSIRRAAKMRSCDHGRGSARHPARRPGARRSGGSVPYRGSQAGLADVDTDYRTSPSDVFNLAIRCAPRVTAQCAHTTHTSCRISRNMRP